MEDDIAATYIYGRSRNTPTQRLVNVAKSFGGGCVYNIVENRKYKLFSLGDVKNVDTDTWIGFEARLVPEDGGEDVVKVYNSFEQFFKDGFIVLQGA